MNMPKLLDSRCYLYIKPNGKKEYKSKFQCECGNIFYSFEYNINNGKVSSCGCYQKKTTSDRFKKHGMCNTRIYKQWAKIKNRCLNNISKDFHYYGGRGILICDEWLDFENYFSWAISAGYNDSLEIDRINTDGNYEPSNCRFVNRATNVSNINVRRDSTTGYTGITNLPNGKFRAIINVDKKPINLGCFQSISDAISCRNAYIDNNNLPHKKG